MKSVAFLRNTWKKWENKSLDGRDNTETTSPSPSPRDTHSKSRTANPPGRSLTVTVKHTPLEISTAGTIDGSWQPSHPPPSPIYDQFTQQRSDRTVSFSHRDSSRITLDVTYPGQNSRPSRSAGNSPTPPTPIPSSKLSSSIGSPRTWKFSHGSLSTPSELQARTQPRRAPPPPPSPRTPSLPSYTLLPPIDLNYGNGRLGSSLDAKICQCPRSGSPSKHQAHCPRYAATDTLKSRATPTMSDNAKASQKTVHAVLDLSVDSKPRSLYHLTKSSPHLPLKDQKFRSTAPSVHSICSTEGSEVDFPLSLFPTPPPLIIRKHIPAPLVLRPIAPTHSQNSSTESTPVGTPTTPRFHFIHTPPQSANLPPKKHTALRPYTPFSPPPSSPPNSPLPRVPPYFPREGGVRRCSESHPPPRSAPPAAHAYALRVAQSSANLRDSLPFPATHRLTSSEPSSDQASSLPIKRALRSPAKPRPKAVRASNELRVYSTSDAKEQSATEGASPTSDIHIQWGYAL